MLRLIVFTIIAMKKPKTGFTLIELLVVIAIIGILAAMLLPVLAMAKAKVKMVKSSNNLKQLRLAMCMWSDDMFDGQNPEYYGRSGWKQSTGGSRLDQWTNFWMHKAIYYNGNDHKVVMSPFTIDKKGSETRPNSGSARVAWHWPNDFPDINDGNSFRGSYAFNGWQHPNMSVDESKWDWLYQNDTEGQPDMAPMMSDSIWVDVWPEESDKPAETWHGSWRNHGMAKVSMDRHNGRNLVVFNDGHIDAVELPNMWTLHWHKNWVTPATLPNPSLRD